MRKGAGKKFATIVAKGFALCALTVASCTSSGHEPSSAVVSGYSQARERDGVGLSSRSTEGRGWEKADTTLGPYGAKPHRGSSLPSVSLTLQAPRRVPILMYHYIRVNPDPKDRIGADLSVSPQAFAGEMAWLSSHGYHPVTLRDVIAAWQGGYLPDKPVVLTFDDGYEDVYTKAFATMRQYGFVGVAFVVTRLIGRAGYATADELREMRYQGWEIGGHSRSHVDLTRLSWDALRDETEGAAKELMQMLGERPTSFAYPAGRFNPVVERAVAAGGYSDAVTTQWGLADAKGDLLALPRIRIRGSMDVSSFAALLSGLQP